MLGGNCISPRHSASPDRRLNPLPSRPRSQERSDNESAQRRPGSPIPSAPIWRQSDPGWEKCVILRRIGLQERPASLATALRMTLRPSARATSGAPLKSEPPPLIASAKAAMFGAVPPPDHAVVSFAGPCHIFLPTLVSINANSVQGLITTHEISPVAP